MAKVAKLEAIDEGMYTELAVFKSGIVTIGRDTDNFIQIEDSIVSRRHGCFQEAGSHWIYRDLGSSNGSWINGEQVFSEQYHLLRSNDVITISGIDLRFTLVEEDLSSEASQNKFVSLIVFQNQVFDMEYALEIPEEAFVVGGEDANLLVSGYDINKKLFKLEFSEDSQHNLMITPFDKDFEVHKNFDLVTGQEVLLDRDQLSFGGYKILVSIPANLSASSQTSSDLAGSAQTPKTPHGQFVEESTLQETSLQESIAEKNLADRQSNNASQAAAPSGFVSPEPAQASQQQENSMGNVEGVSVGNTEPLSDPLQQNNLQQSSTENNSNDDYVRPVLQSEQEKEEALQEKGESFLEQIIPDPLAFGLPENSLDNPGNMEQVTLNKSGMTVVSKSKEEYSKLAKKIMEESPSGSNQTFAGKSKRGSGSNVSMSSSNAALASTRFSQNTNKLQFSDRTRILLGAIIFFFIIFLLMFIIFKLI